MPTPKVHFDRFALERLKSRLADKIGYIPANKPDCAKLSDMLSREGHSYLSESTLYRVFFQHDRHTPYKTPLDTLCRFVGFQDSADFLGSLEPLREKLHLSGVGTVDRSGNGLLHFCIERESTLPLTDFFEDLSESSEEFKIVMVFSLFDTLVKNQRTDWFFRSFAHHRYIREYLLEKGHDPKFRIPHYERAYGYYLEKIDRSRGIAQLQDYVFGNCVLFRYHFLRGHLAEAFSLGKSLYEDDFALEPHQSELHIFPFIRFEAYRLWYMKLTGASIEAQSEYADYLLELCAREKALLEISEQAILFHTLAETLLYSELPETYHQKLKKLYAHEFNRMPESVAGKHLKYSLPYFERNGLLFHRP